MGQFGLRAACAMIVAVAATAGLYATSAHSADAPAWNPAPYKPKSGHDFTGIWKNTGGIGWTPGMPPGRGQNPPLTPEYMARWQGYLKDADDGRPSGDPTAACLPQGMPRIMTMTYPMEIIQNERQVNIFAEWGEQTRRVFIDGRPHPAPDDLDPSYYGHTIGHWEGDVLVADTVGLRGDTNLEASGLPHSDQLTVKERLWLADDNTLKDEVTLIDPKAYTHPWTVTKTYKRAAPTFTLMPYVCLENNRNPVDAQGHIGMVQKVDGK